MTKSLDCRVIVSEKVGAATGIARRGGDIRGRGGPIAALAVNDPTSLAALRDPQNEQPVPEPWVA